MKRLRSKLTYANVVASIALFAVMAGGTAFAASELGKETVGTRQLKKAAVTPAKLSKAAKKTLTGPAGPKGATGAVGAKGAAGQKGEAGAKGEVGPRGPSNGYYAFSNVEGTDSKTITLSVPAGSYIASASMTSVAHAGYAEEDCELTSSTESGNAGFVVVTLSPPTAPATTTYGHPAAEAGLNVAAGGHISFSCVKFGGTSTETKFYQARITATRVESLTTS